MASEASEAETETMIDQPGSRFPVLDEMKEEADEWRVEWSDGSSRETTITVIAWYAREFDEEATVTSL